MISADPATSSALRLDTVTQNLRTAILRLELPPGSTVTEALVSQQHGVARPTARTAIDRLVTDGLLTREPHHAARVPVLDRKDLNDLFVTRAAIESAAVELLAAARTMPLDALEAHADLCGLSPHASYAAPDIALHSALVGGCGSIRLARLHQILMGEIALGIAQVEVHRLRSVDEVASEHQDILDAIEAGDVTSASQHTRAHILASRDRLIAHADSTEGQ